MIKGRLKVKRYFRKKQGSLKKVIHLTTVHDPSDPRITYKEAATLARAGYAVTLMGQGNLDELPAKGMVFYSLPLSCNRLDRMIRIQSWAAWAVLRSNADILHIHDPELLPLALGFRLLGVKVVYDIHEDYSASIRAKAYLPRWARWGAGWLIEALEKLAYQTCVTIIAEKYYKDRFPGACQVLNYPMIGNRDGKGNAYPVAPVAGVPREISVPIPYRLLYTGNVTKERGAHLYADIIERVDHVEVWLVGKCDTTLAETLLQRLGQKAHRLKIIGKGRYVPQKEMQKIVSGHQWLAGLAIFPPDPFYERTEPTKFFEYMERGMPIIVSDFPVWRHLVESEGVGMAVSSQDPNGLAGAVTYLRDHPDAAANMGRIGRKAVVDRYNWDGQGKKLLDCYWANF